MAWIFGDGFDLYSSSSSASFIADMMTHWDAITNSGAFGLISAAGTRFAVGQGLNANVLSVLSLTKNSATNDAGHHIVMAYRYADSGTATTIRDYITLFDGTTAQCTICFMGAGDIVLRSGTNTGTVLATFSGAIPTVTTWYGLEFEVVINNTTGSFKLRINGSPTDNFSATGLNTRGGTTNNYANKLTYATPASPSINTAVRIDDFLWFSTSGASPNTWVGDIRCDTRRPNGTASAGLTPSPAVVSNPAAMTGSATTINTNTLTSSGLITTTVGGSLTALTIQFNATYTGHYRLGIYDGTTGAPTTLLAQTAEQTNATVGQVTVNLVAPITVAQGAKLFAAILSDAQLNVNINATTQGVAVAQTYASGLLSSITTAISSSNRLAALASITVDNYSNVSDTTEDADTSFVYGATAGMNDLYGIGPMASTPLSILAVQTRLASRKSDTGTRQARIQVKSGGTTFNDTTYTMGTSYTYKSRVDTVDPATATGWTASGVNSFQIGAYVVA